MATNQTYNQMDNKQAQTIVENRESFRNPYERFIVDATERAGDYIVEDALDEMDNLGESATIFDGETPSIAEVSYVTETKNSYVYNVRKDDLKKVANNETTLEELNAKIQANLDEQRKKDCYRRFEKLISRNATMKDNQKKTVADATAYADILLAIKEDIAQLKKPQDTYTEYSKVVQEGDPATSVTKTLKAFSYRPIVFIKRSLYEEIMVKYASGVFNLEKIAIDADIIPVEDFYTDDGTATSDKKLWLTCGEYYVKIFKDFENRAQFNDLRNTRIGLAVDYKEYLSKLVPAILHSLA